MAMGRKGYRTPSWFRAKGISKQGQAKAGRPKVKVAKSKKTPEDMAVREPPQP